MASQVRVSHEALILARIRDALADVPGAKYATGMGAMNRFALDGWNLVGSQQFQFGDLRIELPDVTVVIEAESAGGVTNLVKYWPHLALARPKRFVLAHLFQVLSANDYVSHMRLWEYMLDRMREDLSRRVGLRYPEDWEARLFRYGPDLDAAPDVASFIRGAVSATA